MSHTFEAQILSVRCLASLEGLRVEKMVQGEHHVARRICVCDVPSHCLGHLNGVECGRRSGQLRKLAI